MDQKNSNRRFFSPRIMVIVLVLAIVLTAVTGTFAWLKYIRSLQTVTLVHVSDLYLVGFDETSTAINLGNINVSEPGSRFYAFGVKSTLEKYRIQLGYTTNIPFSYSIHPASTTPTETRTTPHQEARTTLYYDPREYIRTDSYFNGIQKHDFSYKAGDMSVVTEGTYDLVQACAEPKYWQSVDIDRAYDIDYFVLEITWPSGLVNNKETDMIYLTAGAARGG